ncbi:F0F1 ATP synthase subunit A [Pseudonocardia sp. NPDC049635]|uniref:F0F1 ATP synthase subunit A n=1 Tax=Pseudonocardia sp. NPDC049635 TaxID=3155506 RepID=UPI003400B717
MGELVLAAEEFTPPGPSVFNYPPIFAGVTKPMVLIVMSAIIIAVYFAVATRRMSIVPGKGQFALESFYNVARNGMARDQIGKDDFKPFIPLILGLFSFVLVNNYFGIIPFFQIPTMSKISFPIALALVVYVAYHYAGFRKHGFVGYFKHATLPKGVPMAIAPLIIVIELLQKFLVQPASLALRLFAAMFAGHLMLVLVAVGAEFMLFAGGFLVIPAGLVVVAGIAFTFLEALVMTIQAYIFALLASVFIGAAVAEEH